MGFGSLELFYKEKEDNMVYGKCSACKWYKEKSKLCERYSMITEIWKSCKSYKEKGAEK